MSNTHSHEHQVKTVLHSVAICLLLFRDSAVTLTISKGLIVRGGSHAVHCIRKDVMLRKKEHTGMYVHVNYASLYFVQQEQFPFLTMRKIFACLQSDGIGLLYTMLHPPL